MLSCQCKKKNQTETSINNAKRPERGPAMYYRIAKPNGRKDFFPCKDSANESPWPLC